LSHARAGWERGNNSAGLELGWGRKKETEGSRDCQTCFIMHFRFVLSPVVSFCYMCLLVHAFILGYDGARNTGTIRHTVTFRLAEEEFLLVGACIIQVFSIVKGSSWCSVWERECRPSLSKMVSPLFGIAFSHRIEIRMVHGFPRCEPCLVIVLQQLVEEIDRFRNC